MTSLIVEPEDSKAELFDVNVSDMMDDDVEFSGQKVTGTLKYLAGSNPITDVWGEGYFLCFTLANAANDFTKYDHVWVGMNPSEGSGLVDIINAPDKNGIAKVTDKNKQNFVVVLEKDGKKQKQSYDLSGITLASEG